jgi:protein-disulfide isomerase
MAKFRNNKRNYPENLERIAHMPRTDSAKQRRLKEEAQRKAQTQQKQKRLLIIGGVVLLVVVIFVVVIALNPSAKPVTAGVINTPAPREWPRANGKSLGSPDAKVVIQEFSDFQCPVCERFHQTVLPSLITDYITTGKVRLEFHHFLVIDSNTGGNESHRAAEASECANEQGRFWDYYDILYANQAGEGSGAFADANLKAMAKAVGLDTNKFNSCFDSGKYSKVVSDDEALARQDKLTGTPSLLVNGVLVPNALDYAILRGAIDTELQKVGQ